MTPISLGRPLAAFNHARERAALMLLTAFCGLLVAITANPHAHLLQQQFQPGNGGGIGANIRKASSPLMDAIETISISSLPILLMVGIAAWYIGSKRGAEHIVKPIVFVVAVFSIPGIAA